MPPNLASQYHTLPFTHMISMTAPAGLFEDWWNAWIGIGLVDWWTLTADRPFTEQAIWLGAVADRPGIVVPGSGENPHIHLLVGNVLEAKILSAVAHWPLPGSPWTEITPLDHVWRIVHYVLTQSPVRKDTTHYMARRKLAHHRNQDTLILPLIESPTLDAYASLMRHRQARYRPEQKGRDWGDRWPRDGGGGNLSG
jgi:hypothetical protein